MNLNMETPAILKILFHISKKGVQSNEDQNDEALRRKETRRVLRQYERLVKKLGEERTLEGLALAEAFYELLSKFDGSLDYWELRYKFAAALKPWLRDHKQAMMRLTSDAFELVTKNIVSEDVKPSFKYKMAPVYRQAKKFLRQAETRNIKPGTWVYYGDLSDDPVYMSDRGMLECPFSRCKDKARSCDCELPDTGALKVLIPKLEQRIQELQKMRDAAIRQSQPSFIEKLARPLATEESNG